MYLRCGNIEVVFRVFDEMGDRNVILWILIIIGFVKYGFVKKVLDMFY